MVTKVLQGLLYVSCEMYLDDCIVYASSEDQFLVRLKEVFQRFRERGLLLKAKKCEFGLLQIEYVGRVITKEELSMSKVKIQSVLNFEKLRNLHVLRSLLGLTNYFRGIVPNHSLIVKPLQDMIDDKGKKNSPLVRTQSSSDAFQAIRIAITHCPLMHFLEDTDAPIRLYTDASDYGIGGILFQIADSIWRSIAFVSKSFNAAQSRWSTKQKEAYVIFHCCQQMDTLLRDRVFTIHTDHLNLMYMNNNPNSVVTRWSTAMQELDFKIHFVPGSQNKWADTLSCLCPNLMELAMDYTPRLMDAPVFIFAALATCPLASEEESE